MVSSRVRKALIPAAGRGTRFLPLTKSVPKELAPLVTTPALELVVAEAAGNGVTDVLIVTSPFKGAIADYFSPNADLESALEKKGDAKALASVRRPSELATFTYVDQLDPKGLGHAVGHGVDFADGEAIAVLLPDDLVDDRDSLLGPMLDVYEQHGGIVLGLLDVGPSRSASTAASSRPRAPTPTATSWPSATSSRSRRPTRRRARWRSSAATCCRRRSSRRSTSPPPGAGGEIQLTDAMKQLCRTGTPVHGVVFRGRRYDTGDRLEYVKAVVQLAVRHPDMGADFRAWLGEYEPDDD